MNYKDILEIAIVAYIVYAVLKLIKGTRAIQMVYGLVALWLTAYLARLYQLQSLEVLLSNALLYLGIAIIVIFQTEIRTVLFQLGKYFPQSLKQRERRLTDDEMIYEEVILAATTLAAERTGALVIFERDVKLENFMGTGVRLDARISYDLLVTIFNTKGPLHDGAVIIRGDRVAAASCFLPLTLNPYLSKELGTRHRAAIGITEDTDAIAVVVSEETGIISLTMNGDIKRHMDATRLRAALRESLQPGRRSLVARVRAARLKKKEGNPAKTKKPSSTLETVRSTIKVSSAGSGEYQDG